MKNTNNNILETSDEVIIELKKFYAHFPTVHFKKGEIIYIAASEPTHAYAVKSGYVRSYIENDNLDERSISFVLKNELFPVAWLFSKSQTALFNYSAHTSCELYRIDFDTFHTLLAKSPQFAKSMLNHVVSDNVTKMLEVQALEQSSAEARLLHTLDYFCISYGVKILKDLVKINIPLTQKELASFTGLARETVTTEIIKLKKQGLLSVKKRYYSVDTAKLRRLINEDESEVPDLR